MFLPELNQDAVQLQVDRYTSKIEGKEPNQESEIGGKLVKDVGINAINAGDTVVMRKGGKICQYLYLK